MLSYREYEKAVYDWLMSKHEKDEEFTFSVRKKASKGSERDYFVGTENSKYLATSFWNIPCGYPGSSIDLIVLGFEQSERGFIYWLQFFFSRDPDGQQNELALKLIQDLKPDIEKLFPNNFKANSPTVKMEHFEVKPKESFETLEHLFKELDSLLTKFIPIVTEKIESIKEEYPDFIAHRYTKSEFENLINKMEDRFIRYQGKKEAESNIVEEPELVEIKPSKKFTPHLNQILYGPPGTGKTYHTINYALSIIENDERYIIDDDIPREELRSKFEQYKKDQQIRFVTFHPSFTYEDFVEGIKPNLMNEGQEQNSDISYQIKEGVFKHICESAQNENKEASKRFVLIIDEINRGNIPSIFGELITLIEPDKRTWEKEELSVELPYSKKTFSVPSNVYLIGTMNTADRSVEALDLALRRRFEFRSFFPEPSKITQPDGFEVDIKKLLKAINNRIEYLLDKDHTIGHSYFMDLYKAENPEIELRNIFKNKVIPLLEEYFYGQIQNIGLVLGGDFVTTKHSESSISTIFPKNFTPQDPPVERIIYEVKDPTKFGDLSPFVNIYE